MEIEEGLGRKRLHEEFVVKQAQREHLYREVKEDEERKWNFRQ